MTSLFLSITPIIILIWMMTKKNGLPSHIALPITALMVGALQLFYFGTDLTLISANIIAGILSAITPISIVAGAILLNRHDLPFRLRRHYSSLARRDQQKSSRAINDHWLGVCIHD